MECTSLPVAQWLGLKGSLLGTDNWLGSNSYLLHCLVSIAKILTKQNLHRKEEAYQSAALLPPTIEG